ncbi:MAG: bifunctional folylpolyglutamate synthase/dihydrofolate synthase [Trueperaceae bacterium]
MTAADDWTWVERLQRFGVHPGLARTRALLAAFGDPQDAFEIALVAGTNGKGSTVALLDAMLRADVPRRPRAVGADPAARAPLHGSVGRFVSPHLVRFGERFTVDGRPLPDAALADALRAVRPHAERLGATFFEVLVAVAALAFAAAGVGRAVLEVGMGGRLDATNASEPTLSVITQIALDHEAVLGPDVATIAGEKAGVLRAGRPAVTSAEGVALGVVRARAAEIGAALEVVDEAGAELRDLGWAGVEVRGLGPAPIRAPLLGAHQARNLAAAALAARAWGTSWDAVVAGAAAVEWPGRLERLEARGVRWLLDGAHNPAGAGALAGALDRLGARPRVAVVGVTDDRLAGDLPAALGRLAPVLVATRASRSPRAATAASLADRLRAVGADRLRAVGADRLRELGRERLRPAGAGGRGVVAVEDVAEALEAAAALALASADDEPVAATPGVPAEPGPPTVVVAGSLYLVAEARALLLGEAPEAFERWQ